MSTVVSDWAECCAHCGWLEPNNMAELDQDESCTIVPIIVHKVGCGVAHHPEAHELFMSLWNSRTHMEMNEVLLRRIDENTREVMQKFVDRHLTEESYFIAKSDFTINPE